MHSIILTRQSTASFFCLFLIFRANQTLIAVASYCHLVVHVVGSTVSSTSVRASRRIQTLLNYFFSLSAYLTTIWQTGNHGNRTVTHSHQGYHMVRLNTRHSLTLVGLTVTLSQTFYKRNVKYELSRVHFYTEYYVCVKRAERLHKQFLGSHT